MTEFQANTIAKVYGGFPWYPMNNVWLVVVLYADEAAFDAGEALVIIEIDP